MSGVTHYIEYIYDANCVIGMIYHNTTMAVSAFEYYFFEKNLQGDIVAVYNATGTKLVAYTYDAWGNVTTTYYNGGASTGAQYNSILYRGYYYDSETNLYYLNARYYDPATGRFINPDIYINANGDLTGFNMYAYCSNNPVSFVDSWGTRHERIRPEELSAGGGLVITFSLLATFAAIDVPELPDFGDIVGDLVDSVVASLSKLKTRIKDIVKVEVNEKDSFIPNQTFITIFRFGGTDLKNLTPSKHDVALYPTTGTGLSFSTYYKPGSGITTIEAVNATGVLIAVKDGDHHVSIFPKDATLEEWYNAGENSIWTLALKSVILDDIGGGALN